MVGYSSGGFLDAAKQSGRDTIETEVVAIDDVVDQTVGLMKIDVQGGEMDVLLGARKTIANHGIDLIYCEYSGQEGVLEFFFENGYTVFFTEHLLVQRKPDDPIFSWHIVKEKALSSGRSAWTAWPPETMPRDAAGYADFMRSEDRRLMSCQTDLVCVSAGLLPVFSDVMR
ncbi:FkbM family methyltransferase [Bauldia litoralis]|uniref:FkbM family methyltransferase n=1 Tax=Bauldia litoralis TaxID=665467 RepID=UPI0032653A9D